MKLEKTNLLRTQMSKRKVGCLFLPLDHRDLTIRIRTKENTKHWPEYHVLPWGVWRSEWFPRTLSQVERIKGKTFPVIWASQSPLDSQDNFLQPLWASVSFLCNTEIRIPAARIQFSSVQSLSPVWLFATPWTTVHQASLSITIFRNLASVMPVYLMKCKILKPWGWICWKGMERTFTILSGSRHRKHPVPEADWWVNRGRESFLTKAISKNWSSVHSLGGYKWSTHSQLCTEKT